MFHRPNIEIDDNKTVRRASVDDRKKLIDSVDAFIFDCDGEKVSFFKR